MGLFLRGGVVSDSLKIEGDSTKRESWSFSNSFPYEDQFTHAAGWPPSCPAGSIELFRGDPNSEDDGRCGGCSQKNVICKWVKSVYVSASGTIGSGSETKPRNMKVVYIM